MEAAAVARAAAHAASLGDAARTVDNTRTARIDAHEHMTQSSSGDGPKLDEMTVAT